MDGPPFIHYEGRLPGGEFRFVHVEKISTRIRKYNWELFPHRHRDLFQVALVDTGAGQVRFDLGEVSFSAPALIAVPPLVVHSFDYTSGSTGRILTLSDAYVRELVKFTADPALEDMLERPLTVSLSAEPAAYADIASALSAIGSCLAAAPQARGAMMSASVLRVMAHASQFRQILPVTGADMQRRRQLYEQFRVLLEQHFREQLTVARYAAMLTVTERTLHRACTEVAGESPLKIAHRRLVLEAQRLLLYSAMSVSEISYFLGFKDPSHFSRFFMEHVAEPPIVFRRARLG